MKKGKARRSKSPQPGQSQPGKPWPWQPRYWQPPLLPPDAPVQAGQKQNRKARLKSRPDLQLTSRKARSSPMEAKPSKARQPMWMISMMR